MNTTTKMDFYDGIKTRVIRHINHIIHKKLKRFRKMTKKQIHEFIIENK